MPKLDLDAIGHEPASDYPEPFRAAAAGRLVRVLSEAAGLTDLVATHVTVPPGGWSSQRHWHEAEDEIVVVLAGEGTLVDDHGRHPLRAGDVAAFRKGDGNAHHIVNEGDAPVMLFAVSLPERGRVHYPDIGMGWTPEGEMEPE
ncbi:cupin domain-containing protein [Sphingomonas corticis]|uniref:Cupin domain-containing protein n=1 Tax=Sphingomonas corticis TaxID=2722791 RepID=A0ABX1CRP0_9SPHN|nr:cupin domain-containing protein [Sphingomonas corticis]NJR79323.1 cupin domain-containing protein [Sphingomonas corticis]